MYSFGEEEARFGNTQWAYLVNTQLTAARTALVHNKDNKPQQQLWGSKHLQRRSHCVAEKDGTLLNDSLPLF